MTLAVTLMSKYIKEKTKWFNTGVGKMERYIHVEDFIRYVKELEQGDK